MREFIKNAWQGWQNYTDNGKLAALLLVALLLFWFGRKEIRQRYFLPFLYATIMTVCCICPLTAVLLMKYQTRFYDYQWIWNLVPVTIIVALTGTLLWTEWVEKYRKQKAKGWKCAGIIALMIGVIYLCGRMGNTLWNTEEETLQQEQTKKVLEVITQGGKRTDICLWAPRGIMEYARMIDGNICLPYGRNMWDPALNAYSYETYGEMENALAAWMTHAEETGEGEMTLETEVQRIKETESSLEASVTPTTQEMKVYRTVTGIECMEMAAELGVEHVLLPGNLQSKILSELEAYLGIQAESVEGYYWFCIG